MIRVAPYQTIVMAESTWIRVLSLQPDTIRLSVTTQSGLHIVGCQTSHDVTMRVTLDALHGNTADLDVDAPRVRIAESCDQLEVQDQMQTTRNFVFVTLRVGECVAFAETSEPAATPTASD